MSHTDNMRVQVNITIKANEKVDPENMLNKPIIVNDIPVGIITHVKLDESELFYSCEGFIWDRFLRLSYVDILGKIEFELITIQ